MDLLGCANVADNVVVGLGCRSHGRMVLMPRESRIGGWWLAVSDSADRILVLGSIGLDGDMSGLTLNARRVVRVRVQE
jgi:hypothetical protein